MIWMPSASAKRAIAARCASIPSLERCCCCVETLRQEFNSLDAQRESCEAFVASQKAEGWVLVPDRVG
jgi:hypothetical protein